MGMPHGSFESSLSFRQKWNPESSSRFGSSKEKKNSVKEKEGLSTGPSMI
jgi:hypothetical protein